MHRFIYRRIYMKSPGWYLTKLLRKESECAKCKKLKYPVVGFPLHLHHLDYSGYRKLRWLAFFLPDLTSKMQTLCQYHHELVHKSKKG